MLEPAFKRLYKKNFTAAASLTRLTKLDLSRSRVTDIQVISPLTQLRKLNLTCCYSMGDAGFKPISLLTELRSLTICNLLALSSLEALLSLTKLQNLVLSKGADAWLTCISKLPRLQSLRILGGDITDVGLCEIGRLTKLRNLRINCNSKLGVGFKQIFALPKLRGLGLMNSALKDEHLSQIPLSKLHTLCLSGAEIYRCWAQVY